MSVSINDIATKEDVANLGRELKAANKGLFNWMLFFFVAQLISTFLIFHFLA